MPRLPSVVVGALTLLAAQGLCAQSADPRAAVTGGDNWRNADQRDDGSRFLAVQGMAAWYAPVSGGRFAALEPLLRLSWGDPGTAASRDDGVLATPGFMLYVSGKNKVGFNLDVWSPREGGTEVSLKIQSFLHV